MNNWPDNILKIRGTKSDLDAFIEVLRENSEKLVPRDGDMEYSINDAYWLPTECNDEKIVEISFDTTTYTLLEFLPETVTMFPELHVRLIFLNELPDVTGYAEYEGGRLTKQRLGRCDMDFPGLTEEEGTRIEEYLTKKRQRITENNNRFIEDLRRRSNMVYSTPAILEGLSQ